MKKFLLLLFVAVLLASFTACAPGAQVPKESAAQSETTTQKPESETKSSTQTSSDYETVLRLMQQKLNVKDDKILVRYSVAMLCPQKDVTQLLADVWYLTTDEEGAETWQEHSVNIVKRNGNLEIKYEEPTGDLRKVPHEGAPTLESVYQDMQILNENYAACKAEKADHVTVSYRFGEYESIAAKRFDEVEKYTLNDGALTKTNEGASTDIKYVIMPEYLRADNPELDNIMDSNDVLLSADWSVVLE